MKTTLVVLGLLAIIGFAAAACPNHCSGNGKCMADDKCSCFQRWQGPDCSERKCKENIAWVDGDVDTPHEYAECSNMGTCDRTTGECMCRDGFDGAACQRLTCSNKCSGHGTCEYITELGDYTASNWDATKVQGCKCDGGWEGFDCSLRMCPRGDDPLTSHTDTGDVHVVATSANNFANDGNWLNGQGVFIVKDLYNTYETSRPFEVANATQAEAALLDLDIIVSLGATTTVAGNANGGYDYTIQLSDPPHVTSITVESKGCWAAGCYPKRDGGDATPGSVTDTVTASTSFQEAAVCSNRGLCDSATGICKCFEGHTGLACETQSILV